MRPLHGDAEHQRGRGCLSEERHEPKVEVTSVCCSLLGTQAHGPERMRRQVLPTCSRGWGAGSWTSGSYVWEEDSLVLYQIYDLQVFSPILQVALFCPFVDGFPLLCGNFSLMLSHWFIFILAVLQRLSRNPVHEDDPVIYALSRESAAWLEIPERSSRTVRLDQSP